MLTAIADDLETALLSRTRAPSARPQLVCGPNPQEPPPPDVAQASLAALRFLGAWQQPLPALPLMTVVHLIRTQKAPSAVYVELVRLLRGAAGHRRKRQSRFRCVLLLRTLRLQQLLLCCAAQLRI